MKTLVVYASNHGCTEKNAQKLKEKLKHDVIVKNVKDWGNADLADFELIIIGGSIHAGKIQGKIKTFCKKNLDLLLTKKIALFISCMEKGEKAEKQFKLAFPADLIEISVANGFFGGEFILEQMNFIVRKMIKKIAKIEKSVSDISEENIRKFIDMLNEIK